MAARSDRALVLGRHPWSESSLVVHALTAAHGRVHLLARGAYRAGSRYYAALDLFDTLEIGWSQSPTRELGELARADIRVRRPHLRTDLERYRAALVVLELTDLAARLGGGDEGLYALAEGALDALELAAEPSDAVLVRFQLDFLRGQGLMPSLFACAQCGAAAPPLADRGERVHFSAGAGGRLCARCAGSGRMRGLRVGTMPLSVLADLASLAERAWPAGAELGRLVLARDLIGRFLDYHLETRPRSQRAFLSVPNRNAPTAAEANETP